MLTINLDSEYDILFVGLAENESAYGAEEYDGVAVFRDSATRDVTGILIHDFMKRYADESLRAVTFPVDLNLDEIARMTTERTS